VDLAGPPEEPRPLADADEPETPAPAGVEQRGRDVEPAAVVNDLDDEPVALARYDHTHIARL
jgi:hypothetical protein